MCVPQRPNGEACHTNGECQSQGCNGRNADAGTPGTCGLKGGADTTCFVTNGCSYGGGSGGSGGLLGLLAVMGVALLNRRRSGRR
jgi:MYXO-CTERM domain-containing protein